MKLTAQQKWLRLGAGLAMGAGVMIALAAHPAMAWPTAILTDLIFWPVNGAETLASPEARLLSAISGGVLVGWGWALWLLAGEGLAQAPALSRRIILGSATAWFVVDSTASIIAGAHWNVLGNLVFLALFTLPLLRGPQPATV